QARRRERPISLFNRHNKFLDRQLAAFPNDLDMPACGALWGLSWLVELPFGEVFYGFATEGDHEGGLNSLNAFARAEGRLVGFIEGEAGSFLSSDGRTVPVGEGF